MTASIDDNPAVLFISVCGGTSPAPFCGADGPAGSYYKYAEHRPDIVEEMVQDEDSGVMQRGQDRK